MVTKTCAAGEAVALRLALRLADHRQGRQEAARSGACAIAVSLLEGDLSKPCPDHGPHTPLLDYWQARGHLLRRSFFFAEEALDRCQRYSWKDPHYAGLLRLELARLASFRYRFTQAYDLLDRLKQDPAIPACLLPQVLATEVDARVTHRGGAMETGEFPALHRLLAQAHCLAEKEGLTRLFRQELRLRRYRLLSLQQHWQLLRRESRRNSSRGLPAFHRGELKHFRLESKLQTGGSGKLADLRKQLSMQLQKPPPTHVPGLIRRHRLLELAAERKLLPESRVLEEVVDLLNRLLAMDQPGDELDLLNRELLGHGSRILRGLTDLVLSSGPRPESHQIERLLRYWSLIENRHVLDLLRLPEQRESIVAALNSRVPERTLDRNRVASAPVPPSPFATVRPPVLCTLQGRKGLYIVTREAGAGTWQCHRFTASDTELGLAGNVALGRLLEEVLPKGDEVYWVPDAATENLPLWALPGRKGPLGGLRILLQCPGLFMLSGETRPEASAGTLWLKGHGDPDPDRPHLSRILPEEPASGPALDVGDVMRLAASHRHIVLDVCHGGDLPGMRRQNDLGLGMGALIGGADTVLCWEGRVPASSKDGGPRGRFLPLLEQHLDAGRPFRESVREVTLVYHALSKAKDTIPALSFLRLFGRPPGNASV